MKMNEEVEDFEKTIKFDSDFFAIIDGNVAKALKDSGIPNSDKAIYVPTKLSSETEFAFKVVAKYNDASLETLVIKPAAADDVPDIVTEIRDPATAHDGADQVLVKVSKIKRKAGGPVPKTGDTSYRNKGNSAGGNPKTRLTPGVSFKARVAEKGSLKGARSGNYGQPETSNESAVLDFLKNVRNKTITEHFLKELQAKDELLLAFKRLRSLSMKSVVISNLTLIHESIQVLEEHCSKDADKRIQAIEEMISRGLGSIIKG